MIVATSARALALVAGSAALGAAYYAFLRSTPFPPDIVRAIPLLWLAGALWSWIVGVMAIRVDARKAGAVVAVILNVPNTLIAAIFALAAIMGD